MQNEPKRKIVEHKGHRILIQGTDQGKYKYSMYKYVNGEHFGVAFIVNDDTDYSRDMFVKEALRGFERARTAPFN